VWAEFNQFGTGSNGAFLLYLDSIVDVTFFTRQTTNSMKNARAWAYIYSYISGCIFNLKQSARDMLVSPGIFNIPDIRNCNISGERL
jgi:hypothetical protein